jgi:hypothetical protein
MRWLLGSDYLGGNLLRMAMPSWPSEFWMLRMWLYVVRVFVCLCVCVSVYLLYGSKFDPQGITDTNVSG